MSKDSRSYFKKSDIIIILVVVAIAAAAFFLMQSMGDNSQYNYVILSIDGKDVERYNLADYTDRTVVDLSEKYNIHAKIELLNHEARFIEVDCPDKLCEQAGFVKNEMDRAICLPNRAALLVHSPKDIKK